ncbi:PLP-dependent aminotransferase family protein [Desulfospira joergensenii]|uniref:aminotransferase-like domain-containing protein n=1 Tax=Desulfospira joergensenii TaxID=53329 RepID=UPI0003B7B782|nr:PLP-dependent aminotransferase family protein [Desulfospira joergensenii]
MIKIQIDKKSENPLYVQVRDRIRDAISRGEFLQGDKLPTVTAFAKQVGVTQATIRRALEDLTQQGLIHSHVGRGTFVGAVARGEKDETEISEPKASKDIERSGLASRRLRQGVSKSICSLVSAACRPGVRDFSKGVMDPGLIEPKLWEEMVAKAMTHDCQDYIGYGDLNGMPALREEIAERYQAKGLPISPDQILITHGSQQGAAIAALDAAENNRHVWIETPGFQGFVDAFVSQGNRVDPILSDGKLPTDPEPLCPSTLLCICPEFSSPTGETMNNSRRREIAQWAVQNNGFVFSDQVFEDLRFEGKPQEHMINLLGPSRAIVASSLSKSLASGLRLGWMISSPERIAGFAQLKLSMSHACPSLMEGIALAFLRSGAYDEHLERVRQIHKARRDTMLTCLDQLMPQGVTWTHAQGGFFTWVTLPPAYSSVTLLLSLLDKGVSLMPGPTFDMDKRFMNNFRLSWAWTDVNEIEEGMEILADAVKELLRKPPGEPNGLLHF